MPQQSSPDLENLIKQAAQLPQTERLELIASLQALNEAEIAKSQKPNQKQLTLERKGIRGGKGSFEDKYINGYGPYRYLRYWYGKTHKSVYLGKVNISDTQQTENTKKTDRRKKIVEKKSLEK